MKIAILTQTSLLNAPITIAEVEYATKHLNKNKASCPCDNLLLEYVIEYRSTYN